MAPHRRALNQPDGLLHSEAGRARLRRDPTQRNDRRLPLRNQQCQKGPLTCGFGARGGIRTLDLPITSRTLTFQLDPPSTILAAQVRDRFHLMPSCGVWYQRLGCHRGCHHAAGAQHRCPALAPRASDCDRMLTVESHNRLAARRVVWPSTGCGKRVTRKSQLPSGPASGSGSGPRPGRSCRPEQRSLPSSTAGGRTAEPGRC
jgi:hypothetical protein